LGVSLVQAIYLLIRIRPDIAIGTGGYASAPMLLIASFFGIKTFIQEQNSYPGITNKFLSKFAHGIAVAYPNLERFFPSEKTYLTGNPVRDKLIDIQGKRQQAYIHFQLDPSKKTLVVLGGSLGAKKVNQIIEENLTAIKKMDIQLVWQCGKIYQDSYMSYDSEQGIRVLPFVKRMDLFYAVADVIISRAGAGTISELCLVGKPCILVPSPNVTENHQYHNARALADQGAAIVIEESHLAKSFLVKMSELLQDQKLQNKMAIAIKDWAKPNATVDIVKKINALIPTK
jgi:UDP-N-acetylglucosamine--N-acetylmuramyl-(pentapeptide) pyrophosphoryl-undecaprenol N-acetylglucosamine transferase